MQKDDLGAWGEEVAQDHYKHLGYEILATNAFNPKGLRLGEVDFIARRGDTLAFVEVKTRSNPETKFGTGLESVSQAKQLRLRKMVAYYVSSYPEFLKFKPTIDVVIVQTAASKFDKNPPNVMIFSNVIEDSW